MGVFKKTCKRGHRLNKANRQPHNGSCRKCQAIHGRRWYTNKTNREQASRLSKARYQKYRKSKAFLIAQRNRRCLRTHGITWEAREEILRNQNYCCANPGCNRKLPRNGGRLDHNHETGKKRGILCEACNTALGFVKDSIEKLTGLISYLKREQR